SRSVRVRHLLHSFPTRRSSDLWFGFSALLAGLLLTGLLPFIERIFDVQTDLSLLELGDQTHPLLQELVRRAPGTYNHSINVASIDRKSTRLNSSHVKISYAVFC